MTITMTTESMLQYIAQGANLVDYVDDFTELGGGELNDTFLLHCETRDRVSTSPFNEHLVSFLEPGGIGRWAHF